MDVHAVRPAVGADVKRGTWPQTRLAGFARAPTVGEESEGEPGKRHMSGSTRPLQLTLLQPKPGNR